MTDTRKPQPDIAGVKAHDTAQAVADLQARVEALERKVRAASIGALRMTGLPFNADGTANPAPIKGRAEDDTQTDNRKASKWIWATFSEAEIVRRTGGDFKRRKGVYYIRPKGAS